MRLFDAQVGRAAVEAGLPQNPREAQPAAAHLPTRREVTGCRPRLGYERLLALVTTVTEGQPLFASGARRQLNNFIVIGLKAAR